MNEIVVVTTYKRDELLYLCLEAIRNQDENIPIRIFSDRMYSSDALYECAAEFRSSLFFRENGPDYGNSANVIAAMECSLDIDPQIVHCIEDDTILHPGYFDWARKQLATGRYACVCGSIGNDQDTWYTSPCASWRAQSLRQALDLVPPNYFQPTREDMQSVLDAYAPFKKSKYRFGSAEQDGYFLRCIEHFGWKTLFPEKPLCTHLGWYGYNREGGTPPKGTFDERVEQCRRALRDHDFRSRMFGQRITELEFSGMGGL